MSMGGNKAVFLDRDGTINIEKHYLYKVSDFEYRDGALEGLKALTDMGYVLVIVTNQSGIARGYYTVNDYLSLDQWLKNDLAQRGIYISGSYFCPHLPGGANSIYAKECDCRKPKTALFWRAARELNIDMDLSFAVGDKERDLSICNESGVKGILLAENNSESEKYVICEDWEHVIEAIKRQGEQQNGKD